MNKSYSFIKRGSGGDRSGSFQFPFTAVEGDIVFVDIEVVLTDGGSPAHSQRGCNYETPNDSYLYDVAEAVFVTEEEMILERMPGSHTDDVVVGMRRLGRRGGRLKQEPHTNLLTREMRMNQPNKPAFNQLCPTRDKTQKNIKNHSI